jgi:hypothetical protein
MSGIEPMITNLVCNFMTHRLIDGQDLSNYCCLHLICPQSFNRIWSDVLSARHGWLSISELKQLISSFLSSSWCWINSGTKHWLKIPLLPVIGLASHPAVRVQDAGHGVLIYVVWNKDHKLNSYYGIQCWLDPISERNLRSVYEIGAHPAYWVITALRSMARR